jgi:hypothetical protein
MCRTEPVAKEALRRIGLVMNRLGLKLHPEKTRMVDLRRGKESFVFFGLHNSKEAEHTAEPAHAFYAAVAVAESYEANPGTRARVDRFATQRERREADYRDAESCAPGMGKLLPVGERRTEVQSAGQLRLRQTGPMDEPARWAESSADGKVDP